MLRPPPPSTLFPYTTLFRSKERHWELFQQLIERKRSSCRHEMRFLARDCSFRWVEVYAQPLYQTNAPGASDRKSTRLNSSHLGISYAVFCLKKKNEIVAT